MNRFFLFCESICDVACCCVSSDPLLARLLGMFQAESNHRREPCYVSRADQGRKSDKHRVTKERSLLGTKGSGGGESTFDIYCQVGQQE